ncbi:neuromusculin-like protein [Leptotrombidium deliense]|uniref:Neuromusculin-like protein n=1 Tax=Leptotrombidium deliense TaxID=299467 RepID=A0A443SEM4_9ACAR|nr:neuromusculin-like protein [Leptotrombidium deliense]
MSINIDVSILKGETTVIRGVLGSKAELPCRVDLNKCGDIHFITWTKSDQGKVDSDSWTRIYLYSDNVNKPLRDLVNRADFGLNGNNGTFLVIDKLKLTDESFYKCDVTYINGKCPSLTSVQLEILAAPSKPVIEFNGDSVRHGSKVGPFVENDEFTLKCVTNGGRPLPSLIWYRIDRNKTETRLATGEVTHDGNQTWLQLSTKLSRNDLKTKYECRVIHESVASENDDKYKSRVEVDLNVGAVSMDLIGPADEVKETDIVEIACIAHRSRPQVKIKWMNGSKPFENVKSYEIEGNEDGTVTSKSIIEIIVSRFDHNANISCHAENAAMKTAMIRSVQLRATSRDATRKWINSE